MKKIAGFAINALVVVTCIFTCINIGKNWLSRPVSSAAAPTQPPAGTRVEIPELDWSKSQATLVLVISPTCHFCEESVPLYRKLIPAAAAAGVSLVALSPSSEEATRTWVSKSGLDITDVRRLDARSAFHVFPTISLVDSRGVVEQTWTGSLASDHEKEIITLISHARTGASGV